MLACISGPLLPVPSSGEHTGNPIVILNAMMVMAPNIRWHSCQNGLADILSPITMTSASRWRKKTTVS